MAISLNEISASSIPSAAPAQPSFLGPTGRNDVVQKLANYKKVNSSISSLQFPSDLGKYYMKLQMANYVRVSATSLSFTPTDTIILPMATQLSDTNMVKYEEGSLGMVATEIGSDLIKAYNAIAKAITEKKLPSLPSAADIESFFTRTGQLLTYEELQFISGVINHVSSELIGQTLLPFNEAIGFAGYSPNQFFVVLMRGPSYKEYTFHWRLMPRNQNESDTIRHIITTLNNGAAVGVNDTGLFWTFPKVFRLEFVPNSAYLYKFKPAVLQSVQANYAPNSTPAFFKSGAPECVDLTLVFKEMEYWLSGQFDEFTDINSSL